MKANAGRVQWKRTADGAPRAPRPLPQDAIDHGVRYSIAAKIQALTLLVEGFSVAIVEKKTGIPPTTLYRIKRTAFARGFEPEKDPRILEMYVEDGKRPGRPKTITEAVEQRLLANVREDKNDRENSTEVLA